MRTLVLIPALLISFEVSLDRNVGWAETYIDSDFSRGDFDSLGWKAQAGWDLFRYPQEAAKNPGRLARFAANRPDGTLTKDFDEIVEPHRLVLSLDYGWGWGDADQGADLVSFMLLNHQNDGYLFEIHRARAKWAVQWAKVTAGNVPDQKVWASEEIDATQPSVRDGGGLSRLVISRDSGGMWMIRCDRWNRGAGGAVLFQDISTTSFSRLILRGTQNFDDQAFNNIKLEVPPIAATVAVPVADFLNSLGIVTTFPDRGQPLPKTVEMIEYCGFRWVRGGIEGLTETGPTTIDTYLELHRQTGVKFNWGLVSGGTDLKKLIETARTLAEHDALLAFEGNNEPNNWGVTYQGERGGGKATSWLAVAKLQRDLYQSVKSDPVLHKYPVWSITENGAESDNVGLQFLKIPARADTIMPAGTVYADFANVHNYVYHPNSPGLEDNKTWNAADPTPACKVDGLFGNYGLTWAKHFRGYSLPELLTLPRVTTETGCTIGGPVTDEIQALNLLSLYLDQFKRGWKYTSVYLLRDRTDEGGNQTFGFFKRDYTPRKSAVYLHNLTTILSKGQSPAAPRSLMYAIPKQPATVHDLLLQKREGRFALIVWNERVKGSDDVTVKFEQTFNDVAIFDPTAGTAVQRKLDDVRELTLTLTDHPLIVEIPDPHVQNLR